MCARIGEAVYFVITEGFLLFQKEFQKFLMLFVFMVIAAFMWDSMHHAKQDDKWVSFIQHLGDIAMGSITTMLVAGKLTQPGATEVTIPPPKPPAKDGGKTSTTTVIEQGTTTDAGTAEKPDAS